jgi:dolichol-phosphate mannosyltransferase
MLHSVLVVCIPTYNEAATIEKLLERIGTVREIIANQLSVETRVLVIDDNSPDGTASIIETLALPWVEVIHQPLKGGLGPAYLRGFGVALSSGATYIGEMDADLSHQPESLIDLLRPVSEENVGLTIGTRWMPGGAVKNWPLWRQLISRAGTGYAKLILRIPLRDITSGYRIFSAEVLRTVDLSKIESKGYGFQIEMALETLKRGFEIREVPITFVERVGGVSKMSKSIVIEALWKVTIWGFQGLFKRR